MDLGFEEVPKPITYFIKNVSKKQGSIMAEFIVPRADLDEDVVVC